MLFVLRILPWWNAYVKGTNANSRFMGYLALLASYLASIVNNPHRYPLILPPASLRHTASVAPLVAHT